MLCSMKGVRVPPWSRTARRGAPWKWIGAVALIFLVACGFIARFVIVRAEPIVRRRIVETLSNRFKSKVELSSFSVSVSHGIEVSGGDLRIFGTTDPNPYQAGIQPLVAIREFRFHAALRSLFRTPMHVDTVFIKGLELNIPPKEDRRQMTDMSVRTGKLSIFVDKFICEDTKLLINTSNPGKPPLEFAISQLNMHDIGGGQPLQFQARLVNPKPVGDIQSQGLFGPWQPDAPRETPVQGDYSFSNADLSTIKGLGGTLSSTGAYSGTLGNIVVHGETETPDFRVAISGHAVPLRTEFHAVVDGTSGDVYLRPVSAKFLHSSFTATGSIVREASPKGHDIELDVVMNDARIEDLLELGVRTTPPVMSGPVTLKTKLSLPPGQAILTDRLNLAGTFHVPSAHFSNPKIRGKLDSLSLRSQGKLRQARSHIEEDVPADLEGNFSLQNGTLSFSFLHFLIPGTHVDMTGEYTLDGKKFDFHGKARLQATVSQMTTGWKSVLLKPVDPFFKKDGAGTEVPIRITGTESAPHFGLDFHHRQDERSRNNERTRNTEEINQ